MKIKKYDSTNGWVQQYPEVDVDSIVATGTNNSVTYLAGDGSWKAPLYYVVGNTSGTSGYWTGTIAGLTALYDGLTIRYKQGINGATNVYLNINSLGDKQVYRTGTGRLTTHWPVGTISTLTYNSSDNRWYANGDYDSTDDYRIRWQNDVAIGAYIHGYQLLAEGTDGAFYPVTEGGSTANTNTVSTADLRIGGTLLAYESGTDIAAGGTSSGYEVYEGINSGAMEYWNNRDSGWATDMAAIYLVGTDNGDGSYNLDNTSYTSFLTQTIPTSDDGKIYIHIGWMNNTYDNWRLEVVNQVYVYKDGAFQLYSGYSTYAENADKVDGLHATDFHRKVGNITTNDWNDYINGTETGYNSVINMSGSNKPSAYTYGTEVHWSTSTQGKFQIYAPHNGSEGNGLHYRTGWNTDYDAWNRLYDNNYHPEADTWTTARTLSLTGDVTGSVSVDGSANASLTTTVQEVTITDTRDDGDSTPNDFSDKAASFSFTDDITSSPNTWDSVLTMKGWTDNYRAWQLFSSSTSADTNEKLYFRSGLGTSWGGIQTVFTDDYHPNADKWTTARTITLGGDLSGSVSLDGSANVTLSAQVANNSHTHGSYDNAGTLTGANVYSQVAVTDGIVTGLTSRTLTASDIGAAASSHTHSISDVTNLQTSLNAKQDSFGDVSTTILPTNGQVLKWNSSASEWQPGDDNNTDTNTTYSAGSGLSLSGTTFSHSDTSSQASVNNSGSTFIQDVTLDTYGHITGLTSSSITNNVSGATFQNAYAAPGGGTNTGVLLYGDYYGWHTRSIGSQGQVLRVGSLGTPVWEDGTWTLINSGLNSVYSSGTLDKTVTTGEAIEGAIYAVEIVLSSTSGYTRQILQFTLGGSSTSSFSSIGTVLYSTTSYNRPLAVKVRRQDGNTIEFGYGYSVALDSTPSFAADFIYIGRIWKIGDYDY